MHSAPEPGFDSDEAIPACLHLASSWLTDETMLPLPAVNDEEGPRLPDGLPTVVDGHVHLFPDPVFEAIWRWFENYGWPIRYKLKTPEVIAFLLARGVSRVVALHYSHKPGMAAHLNRYMAEVCRNEPRVIGLATVLPGEPDAVKLLEAAFADGLAGVKLHCHVQCFGPDDPRMHELYDACARAGRPLVMHAGREPSSPHYKCDPHALCSVERIEQVLRDYPKLRLCVPHLGADEYDGYARLLERYDNLWLDTTMAVADYFPVESPLHLLKVRPERVLYGTDFPNLPYAWDREVRKLAGLKLPEADQARLLGENAAELFGFSLEVGR